MTSQVRCENPPRVHCRRVQPPVPVAALDLGREVNVGRLRLAVCHPLIIAHLRNEDGLYKRRWSDDSIESKAAETILVSVLLR